MKKLIKKIIYICLCVGVVGLIPLFFVKSKPIDLDIPKLNLEEMEQEGKQAAKLKAAREAAQRMHECKEDDDCIIVAKDPCGCLLGPKGVTAINVAYGVTFSQNQSNATMTTCPSAVPSEEAECSATARPICRAKRCAITY